VEARDVLFSKTQQRLIAALFADDLPRGHTYAEILRKTSGGAGAIHRELRQFQAANLVLQDGRTFAPNASHPIYPELRGIARKLLRVAGTEAPGGTLPRTVLERLARKYLWWMKPQQVAKDPDRLIAQVMCLGTFEDARLVEAGFGKDRLRRVLLDAAPGQFDEKSWAYWHYRLDLAEPDRVPPLPRRELA
jgi:hypothetical protein